MNNIMRKPISIEAMKTKFVSSIENIYSNSGVQKLGK